MPQWAETTPTVTTAGNQILSPSPARKAIIFPAPLTNRYTVRSKQVPAIDVGITLYPLGQPVVITEAEFGQAVKGAWFGISDTAGQVVMIGESLE